jgi:hypothetical protein
MHSNTVSAFQSFDDNWENQQDMNSETGQLQTTRSASEKNSSTKDGEKA